MASAPRKKLIEVSIPLEDINRESARRKIDPSRASFDLHLWWARRPLAACRAVLFAQLVDDPSSCLEEFPTKEAQDAERERLHDIIRAIVPWEATRNETVLHAARYEIARSVARSRGQACRRWKLCGRGRLSTICKPTRRRSTIRFPAAVRSRWRRSGSACGRWARTSIRSRC